MTEAEQCARMREIEARVSAFEAAREEWSGNFHSRELGDLLTTRIAELESEAPEDLRFLLGQVEALARRLRRYEGPPE